MNDRRLIRITPDAVFAADVFPSVQMAEPIERSRRRAVPAAAPDEPAIDPRQVDLFAEDADHAA
jgi:hypothetical protein